jgi:hypothetical protein
VHLKLLVSLDKGIINDLHMEDGFRDILDKTLVDIQITMNLALEKYTFPYIARLSSGPWVSWPCMAFT